MALEPVGVDLVVEGESDFESSINNAGSAVDNLESSVASAGGGFDVFGEIVTGALRKVGEIAINALGSAAMAIVDFGVDSFKGAIEAQEGLSKLDTAITRLGDNAPISAQGARGLADELKNLVGGSDDTVIAMEATALKFDKIGEEIFPRVIEQSADLAASLGIDPVAATQKLSKVLQDLGTDGTVSANSLKNAGLQLSEAEQKKINALAKSGDMVGAQTLLLDALAKTTSGAAAAAAGTASGQWAIFQETIADAGEGVAMTLLPALTTLMSQVLPQLIPIIEQVATAASDFLVNQFIPAFMTAVTWVQTNWPAIQQALLDSWAAIQPTLQAVGDYINAVVIPAFNTAVSWVVTNWPMIQATIQAVMDAISTVITAVLTTIQAFWAANGEAIMTIVTTNFNNMMATIDTIIKVIQVVIETTLAAIQVFWEAWGPTISGVVDTMTTVISDVIGAFASALQGDWTAFGEGLRSAWEGIWTSIQAIVTTAVDIISTMDWAAIGSDILKGIAGGITAATSFIVEAANTAAQAALDAIKGFLGIQSPSTLFAHEVGEPSSAGIAEGMIDNIGMVEDAGKELGQASIYGASKGASVTPPMMGNQMTRTISNSYSNQAAYNLTLNTQQSSGGIIRDFSIMQVMNGG